MTQHATLDTNHDGHPDVWLTDATPGDGFASAEAIDRNYDGTADVVYVDSDDTGYADKEYLDTDLDGRFDYSGDVTGDGISMDSMNTLDSAAVDEHTSNQMFHE